MEFFSLIILGCLGLMVNLGGKNMDYKDIDKLRRDCGGKSKVDVINTGGGVRYKCKGDEKWRKL